MCTCFRVRLYMEGLRVIINLYTTTRWQAELLYVFTTLKKIKCCVRNHLIKFNLYCKCARPSVFYNAPRVVAELGHCTPIVPYRKPLCEWLFFFAKYYEMAAMLNFMGVSREYSSRVWFSSSYKRPLQCIREGFVVCYVMCKGMGRHPSDKKLQNDGSCIVD